MRPSHFSSRFERVARIFAPSLMCNLWLPPFCLLPLTSAAGSGINIEAAVAATRGDLGQLAPRKKLLKSFSSFPEDFLRPSEHFGAEGFSFLPSLLP